MTSDLQWWNAHEHGAEAGDLLVGLVRSDDVECSVLRNNTRRLINIYEYGSKNTQLLAGSPTRDVELDEDATRFNVARNLIETMAAKLCKSRIAPMVLTDGGGYLERHRARQVDKAIEGEFEANNVNAIKNDVVLDALVTDHGAGAAKVYARDGRVCIEHVPIEDIRFDQREIRRRDPRSLYQLHDLDKYVAAHRFPEHQQAIMDAAGQGVDGEGESIGSDRVMVYEAWHLPSGEESEDGRHVIAVAGATLLDEEYERCKFPFAIYVPRPRRRSVWGLSRMRDCAGGQKEHEKLTERFQQAHQAMGMSGFLVPKDANVSPLEIQNVPGLFVEYTGSAPPIAFTPQPVHADQYGYRDSIERSMGNQIGVSQLAANSQLPAGLQNASGKALQVYEDFESERLAVDHQALEQWTMDLAWLVIYTARDITETEEGRDYESRYPDKGRYEAIKWREVCKDAEKFVIRIFPVSSLAKQPSARFAQLQELLNAGAITVEQFRRLYDLPDLDGELELETADTDIVDRMLERIVLEGKTFQPEPFDNLQLLITRGAKFYNLCRVKDVPDGRLELLREFMTAAKELLTPPAPPPDPAAADLQAAQMQAAPIAPGMPPEPPMPPDGMAPPNMPPVAA